jgi:phosphoglycerol transferase MdoB-like AlkP superfamily enzyme
MKNKLFGTPKLKFLYSLILFQLVLYTIYRLVFLAYFSGHITPGSSGLVFQNLLLGLRFDLRLATFVMLPALLFINLPLNPAFKVRWMSNIYTALLGFITFLYIVDAGYFSYLNTRLNSTVIQFMKNPLISFEMVHESYPWPWLLLLILALTAGIYFILRYFIAPKIMGSPVSMNFRTHFAGGVIFFFVGALGIYGSLKMYPLRWSEAFSTPDAFTSNLSLNPILYTVDTYSFRNAEFDKEKTREYYNVVADFLGVDEKNAEELNFVRSFPEDAQKRAQQPNIVVIVMESLAYFKTGVGGSGVNPTPYFDQIANESLLYTNFYTPTVATARSIFAAVTSIPDTSKVKTGSRNPFIVNQNTIMGQFHNYDKFYFLGGSANWGNIRGVFTYNIPGLHIYEEGSYKAPKVDVWGISDLHLFQEAHVAINEVLEKNKKPFFAFIQSSGFHRPYTIPADSGDFVIKTAKDISLEEVLNFGFESFEEYNAMRLQDYSLGKFFELAKKEAWYDNTIFVVFGDHAIPHNNSLNVPEWRKSQANGYHVPMIIHSPKYIQKGIETKLASELDVMPTIAGMAGIPYKTRSLGRDLFNPKYDNYRVAFSYNWNAPFQLSLVDKDFYFEYIPYNNQGKLVKYSENPADINVKDQYPEKYKEMETLSKALHETSRYLLNNNPRMY